MTGRADGAVEDAAALTQTNELLRAEIAERRRVESELRAINEKLKEAQNRLLQSEKLASVGQLAAGVAHEINNPVGYIKSNLGTLRRYLDDLILVMDAYQAVDAALVDHPEIIDKLRTLKEKVDLEYLKQDVQDLLRESEEGVERVQGIVQDLKDFSHVDEAEWQWADLHKGLESTLNIVRNELKYKADVVKEYGNLPLVECIPSQINQVFTNLLVNASQAIEEHGSITIRTGHDGDEVWVSVADTGRGIASENLQRIFDPFFTTKPVGKGTGLGLSLSYGIVHTHNGRIEVDSQVGRGTTFTVRLPVRQRDNRAAAGEVATAVCDAAFSGEA